MIFNGLGKWLFVIKPRFSFVSYISYVYRCCNMTWLSNPVTGTFFVFSNLQQLVVLTPPHTSVCAFTFFESIELKEGGSTHWQKKCHKYVSNGLPFFGHVRIFNNASPQWWKFYCCTVFLLVIIGAHKSSKNSLLELINMSGTTLNYRLYWSFCWVLPHDN